MCCAVCSEIKQFFNVWSSRKKGFEILGKYIWSQSGQKREDKDKLQYDYDVLACEQDYEILTKHKLTDQIIYQTTNK